MTVFLALASMLVAREAAASPFQAKACLDGKGAYHEPGTGPCLRRVSRVIRGTLDTFDAGLRVEVSTTCDLDAGGRTIPHTVALLGASGFDWSDQEVNDGRRWVLCSPDPDELAATGPLTNFSALRLFNYYDAGTRLAKTWLLVADGVEVASGRVRIRVKRIQTEKYVDIYDTDFDRYINICINGGHRLYARGGHLYCTVLVRPALTRVTAQIG